MKKHFILLLTVVAFSGVGYSQTNAAAARTEKTEIYTSLKPKDAQPAVFSSQEELNARVQDKKKRYHGHDQSKQQ